VIFLVQDNHGSAAAFCGMISACFTRRLEPTVVRILKSIAASIDARSDWAPRVEAIIQEELEVIQAETYLARTCRVPKVFASCVPSIQADIDARDSREVRAVVVVGIKLST
jgi:hypothetical protein